MDELNKTQRHFIEEHVEDYRDGLIARRELVRRVRLIAGSASLATTVLAACDLSPRAAPATSRRATAAPRSSPTRRHTTLRSGSARPQTSCPTTMPPLPTCCR